MLTACGSQEGADITPQGQICRRVDLVDRFAEGSIRGAEDIAIDPERGIGYISAYDRFALEDALDAASAHARNGASSAHGRADAPSELPRGGLYAVDLEDLVGGHDRVAVRELTGAFLGSTDFRPHGIDFFNTPLAPRLLAAVVHRYDKELSGGDTPQPRWRRHSGIALFEVTDSGLKTRATIFHDALCQANDVAVAGPRSLFVTRDHGACGGWEAHSEDFLGLKRSSVMHVALTDTGDLHRAPVPVAGRIGFANGIAIDRRQRRIVVAATREKALLVYDLERLLAGDAGRPSGRLSLPGGPDNLTITPEGELLAAVHPSLFRMGLYRWRMWGTQTAPSQAVRLDMRDASKETLYLDGDGGRFPAATVAARYGAHLILGSVGAPGLLVCSPEA